MAAFALFARPWNDSWDGVTSSRGEDDRHDSGSGAGAARDLGELVCAAWIAVCTASLACVVLIVSMLQNTRQVEVTFLGMQGRLPLASALLIACVGTAILVTLIGTARITQLRRPARRRTRSELEL